MNHNQQANGNFQQSPKSEEQYREELAERVVGESVGNVAFFTAMDLTPNERQSVGQSLTERSAISGVPSTDTYRKSGGGYQEYADVSYVDTYQNQISDLDHDKDSTEEKVIFDEQQDGQVAVVYKFDGFQDNSGRPGAFLRLGFKVSAETAAELKAGVLKDPSCMDEVAESQLRAIGLPEERIRGYFHINQGKFKRNQYQGDPSTRSKSVYMHDESGRVVKQEIAYRDKQPLDIPQDNFEQAPAPEQIFAPEETYDVETNIAANQLRKTNESQREAGFSHFSRALMLKADGAHEAGDAAAETVYQELATESPEDIMAEIREGLEAEAQVAAEISSGARSTDLESDMAYLEDYKKEVRDALDEYMTSGERPLTIDEVALILTAESDYWLNLELPADASGDMYTLRSIKTNAYYEICEELAAQKDVLDGYSFEK